MKQEIPNLYNDPDVYREPQEIADIPFYNAGALPVKTLAIAAAVAVIASAVLGGGSYYFNTYRPYQAALTTLQDANDKLEEIDKKEDERLQERMDTRKKMEQQYADLQAKLQPGISNEERALINSQMDTIRRVAREVETAWEEENAAQVNGDEIRANLIAERAEAEARLNERN
jgi:hypothetical protein